MDYEDERYQSLLHDVMWAIAREEGLDWDRHRGLLVEKAIGRVEKALERMGQTS